MININELRRLAQAATHPTTKGRWMRLFGERTVYDRLEDGCRGIPIVATDYYPPGPQEAAYLDFIAAANPATISELLDRLEAAEKAVTEAYQRGYATGQEEIETELAELRSSMKFRTSLIGRTEAERDALRAELKEIQYGAAVAHDTIKAMRTKITEMERQEPVGTLHDDGCFVWRETAPHQSNYAGWKMALYAIPGAQNVPSVPTGWQLVPKQATREMVRACASAARAYMQEYGGNSPHVMWSAMLAAAPEAKPCP